MTNQAVRLCAVCQRATIHLEQRPNHVLHLLLTIFTFGLWAFVWILLALGSRDSKCTACGTPR